jgi:hypothetical protein
MYSRLLTVRVVVKTNIAKKNVFDIYLVLGAGRKPDAASCPGGGRMVEWGSKRGLNGMLFRIGGGALGFVGVTN